MANVKFDFTKVEQHITLAALEKLRRLVDQLSHAVRTRTMSSELFDELQTPDSELSNVIEWLMTAQAIEVTAGSGSSATEGFTDEQLEFCKKWTPRDLALFEELLRRSAADPRMYFKAIELSYTSGGSGRAGQNQQAGKFLSAAVRLRILSRRGRPQHYLYRATSFTLRYYDEVVQKRKEKK